MIAVFGEYEDEAIEASVKRLDNSFNFLTLPTAQFEESVFKSYVSAALGFLNEDMNTHPDSRVGSIKIAELQERVEKISTSQDADEIKRNVDFLQRLLTVGHSAWAKFVWNIKFTPEQNILEYLEDIAILANKYLIIIVSSKRTYKKAEIEIMKKYFHDGDIIISNE